MKNSVGGEANVGRFEEGQASPSRRCIAARSSLEADVPGSLKPWLAIRQGGKLSRQAIRVDALGLWESPFSFCYSFGMAQERKSPQEKKQLEYTRSHFTFSNRSDRVFSKVWKRKKAHANRVVRRKGDDLLAQAKPGIGAEDAVELGEGITTSRIEKFKIPERLRKRGTVSVGEKVRLKLQRRKETVGRRTLSHEKYDLLATSAVKTVTSLEGNELKMMAHRMSRLCQGGDPIEFQRIQQSSDPIDQALKFFDRVFRGSAPERLALRRNKSLCKAWCDWIDVANRILQRDRRPFQTKAEEKLATEKKLKAMYRAARPQVD